jgi:hypothetical protein
VLAWLAARGFAADVLRTDRVGADPGPNALPRPAGLLRARTRSGVPVLDHQLRAVRLQSCHAMDDSPSGRPKERNWRAQKWPARVWIRDETSTRTWPLRRVRCDRGPDRWVHERIERRHGQGAGALLDDCVRADDCADNHTSSAARDAHVEIAEPRP